MPRPLAGRSFRAPLSASTSASIRRREASAAATRRVEIGTAPLVALPECLLFLDSALLPDVGLVGETREAEHRRIPATEEAPVPVLLVRGLPVLRDIEPDVDVARWQDEWPGDPMAPGADS